MKVLHKELEKFAKLPKQKSTLGYAQANVGITLSILFGKPANHLPPLALQLSFKNLWKLLEKWVEEADNNENLQEVCKAKTLVQAGKRKQMSIENCVGRNPENMFQQCRKPNLRQTSIITKKLGLEKDVICVWFYNRARRANDQALTISKESSPMHSNWGANSAWARGEQRQRKGSNEENLEPPQLWG